MLYLTSIKSLHLKSIKELLPDEKLEFIES